MAKKGKATKPKGGNKGGKKGAKRAAFKAPISTKTGKAADDNPIPTTKVTPGTTLKSLLSTCRGLKANSDSIIGKMREEIGYAKEHKHLHTPMFALLRRFDKMEAEKAAESWHTLVRYMELSGVMAKIEAVGRLPLGDDAEGEEGEEGEEVETGETEKPQAAAAGAKASGGKGAGKGKEKNGEANGGGIKPAAGDADNVSRPKFGSQEHADMLAQQGKLPGADAEAAGKPH